MRYYQSPVNDSWVNHKGHPKGDALDLGWFSSRPATKNQPIYAIDEGNVLFSGTTTDGGETVVIKHPFNDTHDMWVGYMHLSKRNATVGASVKQGQQIGNMGTTGQSKGEHLHVRMEKVKKGVSFSWANYSAGTKVNPVNYLYVYPHQYVEDMQKLPDKAKDPFPGVTDEELAVRVWKDEFGINPGRREKLGIRYAAVQALVEKGVGKPKPTPTPSAPKPTLNKHGQAVVVGQKIQFSYLYGTPNFSDKPLNEKTMYFTEKRGTKTVGYGWVEAITENGYRVKSASGSTIGFVRPVNTY